MTQRHNFPSETTANSRWYQTAPITISEFDYWWPWRCTGSGRRTSWVADYSHRSPPGYIFGWETSDSLVPRLKSRWGSSRCPRSSSRICWNSPQCTQKRAAHMLDQHRDSHPPPWFETISGRNRTEFLKRLGYHLGDLRPSERQTMPKLQGARFPPPATW